MTESAALCVARNRAAVMEELRRLLPGVESLRIGLPFGVTAIDSHLPAGGLVCGALHEIVPDSESCIAVGLGFMVACLGRLPMDSAGAASTPRRGPGGGRQKLVFVMPAYGLRHYGRLHGHGLRTLGLDPASLILVETRHRRETLWAMEEALRSAAPVAVAGILDQLDLKTSQRLHLAATDAGLPLLLLRPASTLESSAAATRWRIGAAAAARDRFGLLTRPRWHLTLERCRNGRPGEWLVEYDHVAHRFSLAAALADPARSDARETRETRETGAGFFAAKTRRA
jgi:protein ImuA